MFQNPVGDARIYGTVWVRKMQPIENLSSAAKLVLQHAGININAGDFTDLSKHLGRRITWTGSNLEDLCPAANLSRTHIMKRPGSSGVTSAGKIVSVE
jgi:hypothetical protein